MADMKNAENPYVQGKNLSLNGKRLIAALQALRENISPDTGSKEEVQKLAKQIDATEYNLAMALKNFDTVLNKLRARVVSSQS